jgi:hypothetical protein
MRILTASSLYFALVFGAGFALGVVRTLFVVPHVGTRSAELMEMPVMLLVTVAAARWTVVRLAVPSSTLARLGTGCIALLLMLAAEFGLVLRIRRISFRQNLATRDRVSGAAYYLMLIVFAVMPLSIRKL